MGYGTQYNEGNDKYTEWVYYEGTDTLYEGYCLCKNADTTDTRAGTTVAATAINGERTYRVEKPTILNIRNFAGWVHPDSNGKTGPCLVRIFKPGSDCNVYAKVNATINVTRLTVCAAQYYMYKAGFEGEGSALALQTVDRNTTAGLIQVRTDGRGVSSGGVELVDPAAGGAVTCMVGGVTYFVDGAIATANATFTLANGTWAGQKKAFFCNGTNTGNSIVITVTTPLPVGATGSTAPSGAFGTYTMDAAAEYLSAAWNGKAWACNGAVGTT